MRKGSAAELGGREGDRETVAEANSCGSSAGKGGDDGGRRESLGVWVNGGCGETGRREEDNGESKGGAAGRAIQRERGWGKYRRKDSEKRQRANGGQSFTVPDFIVQLKLTRPVVDLKKKTLAGLSRLLLFTLWWDVLYAMGRMRLRN